MANLYVKDETGLGLLISVMHERPHAHLQDYDEFTADSLSIIPEQRRLTRNYTSTNTWINYYFDALEELEHGIAESAKSKWELETGIIKGTHGDVLKVDYDDLAWEIYNRDWLPLLEAHCEWIKQQLADTGYDALSDYIIAISDCITYSAYSLFDGLEVNLDTIHNKDCDEGLVHKLASTWLQHLQNQMATSKGNFTVHSLDMFLDFLLETDEHTSIWLSCSREETGFDISKRLRKTVKDLYINMNPFVHVGYIGEHQQGISFDLIDYDEECTDSSDQLFNAAIMCTAEQLTGTVESINQFGNGEWYHADTIRVIPQSEYSNYSASMLHKHEDVMYIYTGDSCGAFESEEAAIEHFYG